MLIILFSLNFKNLSLLSTLLNACAELTIITMGRLSKKRQSIQLEGLFAKSLLRRRAETMEFYISRIEVIERSLL